MRTTADPGENDLAGLFEHRLRGRQAIPGSAPQSGTSWRAGPAARTPDPVPARPGAARPPGRVMAWTWCIAPARGDAGRRDRPWS